MLKRTRRKRYKKFTKMVTVGLLCLIGISIGLILLIGYQNIVEKRKAVAYQKLQLSVKEAEKKASTTLKQSDLEQLITLSHQLKKKDQSSPNNEITRIEKEIQAINTATAAVTQYQKDKSSSTYDEAQTVINLLNTTNAVESKQKATLSQKLMNLKAQVDQAQVKTVVTKYAGKKLVALTFDDGPNPVSTPQILSALKSAGVHATFFDTGQNAQAYPDVVKKEAADGNIVSSHSMTHPNLTTLSPTAAANEIMQAHTLIDQLAGQTVNFYRPPYGSVNPSVLGDAPSLSAILWGVDTLDWKTLNSQDTINNAVNGAYDGAIILMHSIYTQSAAAVPAIIADLESKGYTFVTVPELIEAKEGVSMQPEKEYFGAYGKY